MKKTAFITPRQTGKTTHGIYEFLKDPENTLWVSVNVRMTPEYIQKKYRDQVVTPRTSLESLNAHKFNKVIWDEYLFIDQNDRSELMDNIVRGRLDWIVEIVIFSTPKECYNRFLFEFIKDAKSGGYGIQQIVSEIEDNYMDFFPKLKYDKKSAMKDIYDLYYNILTDPDCKIVDTEECFRSRGFNSEPSREMLQNKSLWGSGMNMRAEGHGEYLIGHTPHSKKV